MHSIAYTFHFVISCLLLLLCNIVYAEDEAKIILQDGGKLIVNGGSIINSTIEVNNSAKLQLLNDGMLYLKQRGNIEVLLGGEANLDYGRVLIQ